MNIIIFIIILLVLVLVHEFGHFFSAKKFGIRVDEFGFGFPPKLFSKKYGETEYSLNLLPIGGFVRIFGENPNEDTSQGEENNISGPDSARSFINKPRWQQAIVLFAGVFANFLLAWLLFSIGFMSGLPTSTDSGIGNVRDAKLTIVSVASDSPASKALLKSGDKIVSVSFSGEVLNDINSSTFKDFIVAHPNEKVSIGYLRGQDGVVNSAEVVPTAVSEGGTPMIGISMDMIGVAKLPILTALKEGASLTLFVGKSTIVGLYTLIRDSLRGAGSLDSVTGPVGMVSIVGDAYKFGFAYLLSFTALISVNLGIINLLPFPALDGGRLLFLLIEKIKGSRLNPKFANTANMIGFSLLILFMIVVTYHDIVKLF